MKLAIMQPYLFPYIGYFQLIASVDKLVVYDDVNYIKGGWINRNNLLISKKAHLFTVPLDSPSPFSLIKETKINSKLFENWRNKFLRSVEQSYKKAPFFTEVYNLIHQVLTNDTPNSISILTVTGIRIICSYLNISTEIIPSSEIYKNNNLKGQERVLDICAKENATHYINVIGGVELYAKETFAKHGIQLNFIKSDPVIYKQFGNEFVPSLSIVDVLMFNSKEEIKKLISQYNLI